MSNPSESQTPKLPRAAVVQRPTLPLPQSSSPAHQASSPLPQSSSQSMTPKNDFQEKKEISDTVSNVVDKVKSETEQFIHWLVA